MPIDQRLMICEDLAEDQVGECAATVELRAVPRQIVHFE